LGTPVDGDGSRHLTSHEASLGLCECPGKDIHGQDFDILKVMKGAPGLFDDRLCLLCSFDMEGSLVLSHQVHVLSQLGRHDADMERARSKWLEYSTLRVSEPEPCNRDTVTPHLVSEKARARENRRWQHQTTTFSTRVHQSRPI